MLTKNEASKAGQALFQAERTCGQIGLLSLAHPDATLDDAYAIQDAFVAAKLAAGERQVGWKIGLTSKAMQAALNIATPDSGVLTDTMMFDDGVVIPKGRFIQPRIEAEIAFVLKASIHAGASVIDVLNATDYIVPALEILDTRILRADPSTKKTRTIIDTVADNAANAGVVLGGRPLRPDAADMRWIGAIVSRNGEVEETGLGAGVLNHPARGIVWLANRLANYGRSLKAGDVVLAGSFIRPVEAPSGSTIVADYGAAGTVSCHFA